MNHLHRSLPSGWPHIVCLNACMLEARVGEVVHSDDAAQYEGDKHDAKEFILLARTKRGCL